MQSVYNDFGRVTQKTFASDGKLQYTYNKGLLTDVTRTADEAGQSIACDYDAFGNLTAVRIGGLLLASYQYAAKNGQLMKQVYGNGQEVTFTYDRLGRTSTASYSGGRTLTYAYNGDGQLYSIRDDAGTETAADDVTYFYTYDSLKRAIACRICRGIERVLSVYWEYDDSSRIKTQAWQMGQQSYSESYTYSTKDGSLTSVSMNGGSLQLGYDALSRLSTASNGVYTRNYTYRDISGSQTTTQVEKLRYTGLNGALSGLTYNYTYNPLGNIASVTSDGSTSSYTYDAMGQLTAASLPGMQYAYTYDGAGNLQTVTRGETTNTYTYGNASWKDLLTEYNGGAIIYEGQEALANGDILGAPTSGNPISYYNGTCWNFGWSEGRNLTQAVRRSSQERVFLSNKYDGNGLRISKSVTMTAYEPNDGTVANPPIANEETTNHSYIYAGGKLLRETITEGSTTKTLDFTYDNVGMPYSLIYNSGTTTTTYYYITNLQGDVMYLVDSSGNEVSAYDYDPYGKVITATGAMAEVNPLRYRGYYYDTETGFYYLQSRYYDPEICRFINADSYASTGQSYLGYNMFAYCANNPIAYTDLEGEAPWSALPYWGYIHNLVVKDIVVKYSNSERTLSSEVSCSTGRMDIFDKSSGEVWEVKSAGPASLIGVAQLYRYTQGTYKGMPIIIGRDVFCGEFDRGNFHVKYWTVASGLIVYDFSYKGKEKEIVTVSAYEKQESEQKSTPKVGGIAMAAAGALGAGQAGAAIVSAIGGPLTSFKRNYYCFQ